MLERLATFVTSWRWTVISVGLLGVLALARYAPGVPLDNSVRVWMVDSPEKLASYHAFREAFGSDEQVLAVVRGLDGKERGDRSLLLFVRDLASLLEDKERCPQVEEVVSILTLARDDVRLLLDEKDGWKQLPRIRRTLTRSPLARDFRLLDLEHDVACVGITLREGSADDRRALLARLEEFRARARREGREMLLAGQPIVNVELDQGAREVEGVWLPLLIGVCVATMLGLTRSARVTALVLAPVGLSVLAMTGLVGATGQTFNLLLVIAKPLIFVLALATGLHFAQSYLEGLREGMDRVRAAKRAFDEKAVPCLFTTAAAVYGFGSLVTAGVRPIRALGAFSAAGMIVTCGLMIGPLLAALASFGPARPPLQGPDRFGALAESVVRFVTRSRGRAVSAILACIALCVAGGLARRGLAVDTNALNYFKADRPVRTEYAAIEREGLGLFAFEMLVRSKDGAAAFGSTATLQALRDFEAAARVHTGVTATLSFADALVDFSWRGRSAMQRDDPAEVLPAESLIQDALSQDETVAATKHLLGQGAGLEARAARVTVIAKTGEATRMLELRDGLAADFARIAGPRGLEAELTGTAPLMLETQLSLVGTLGTSLGGAALTIGATLLVFVRSLRRALLAVLPNALPILLNFGVMRAASMPLDVGTVMVSSIVLGIAVDNTIHYFFHYRRALERGEPLEQALQTAARIAGRSLVLATAITVTGFLVLLPSAFAPTWRFGVLAASGLAVAVVGTIIVLPALPTRIPPRDVGMLAHLCQDVAVPAPAIVSVRRALPSTIVDQETAIGEFLALPKSAASRERVEQFFRATGVKTRHVAAPVADYKRLDSFPKKNALWTRAALELGAQAVSGALDAAGLRPRDVDHIFFTTVTGIAVPSIDARLVNLLGFRPDVKRTPIFGLGCVAGVAGTSRAADYLRGAPHETALLLSVELCTLTLQLGDASIANVIASGLFGDGAAALVMRGGGCEAGPAPRATASARSFYPGTEDAMGWEIVDGGFKVLLSGSVPELARENVARDVDAFLASRELDRSAIRHWVSHTGGPKVLVAFEEALALPEGALARTWRSLEEAGNLSSASVLLVLEDLLASGEARPGDKGLMIAMGPGFCSEIVLLEW